MFKSSQNFESVEVFRLLIIERKRRKREVSLKGYTLQVDYIVQCKNKTNYESMRQELKESAQRYDNNNTNDKSVDLDKVTLNIKFEGLNVNKATEGGRCTVPGKTDCAKDSTDCVDYDDGTSKCTCKKGYKPSYPNLEYKYCNDIHECNEFVTNKTIKERCVNGVCKNSLGSWTCTCDPDRLLQNIGNNSYPVYRCQGNFSYIGNISVADYNSSRKSNITEFIQKQLKIFYKDPKNENKSFSEPISSLFVDATVLSLFENISHSSFRQYNTTFLLRIGEFVESERVVNVLKNVLNRRDYRIHNNSLDVAFEKSSYLIFKDDDNKLCTLGSNGNCDKLTTTCNQINGSTSCVCKEGFHKTIESKNYCTDINECEIEGKCNNETCVNSFGNWSCKCKNSYSIPVSTDKNNFSCKDVTVCEYKNKAFECKNGNRTCRSDTQKWECTCKTGLSPVYKDINTLECEDVNECTETGEKCSGHGTCENKLHDGYSCNCEKGFTENATNPFNVTCEDINECDASNYSCVGGGKCNNSMGGWGCSCNAGYQAITISQFNISCEDIDECKEPNKCGDNGKCNNTEGSYICTCPKSGYVQQRFKNESCKDIDECNNNSYYCAGTCHNTMGNWTCTCPEGFRAQRSQNGTRILCIDNDECIVNKNCSGHGKCVNYPVGFGCECYDGFMFDSKNQTCIDVDECQEQSKCGDNGKCNNTEGSYICTCPKSGYVQQRFKNESCKDVNECAETGEKCSGHGTCKNKIEGNGYSCKCEKGYKENATNPYNVTCEDIDECNERNNTCGDGGACKNTDGNYECTCPKHGFIQRKYQNESCKDINECTNKSYYCGGVCKNTVGSWTCKCSQGYSKESNNETIVSITCEDINECDTSAKCVDGVCINQDGSWRCDCQDGKQPESFNSTVTICRGGYQYIMSTEISVPTSSDVKPNEINIYMKAQIQTIYGTKFQNQHVRVEILSVIRIDSGKRRKRQATESYDINFVLHFKQSIPYENISLAWTEYIQSNCIKKDDVVCPAPKSVRALPVVIANKIKIAEDQSTALCNLDKYNHCDPDTSTCHYVNGSANCDCKKGYTKKQSNLTCEVSDDVCKQNPCENGGTCQMTLRNEDFKCVCRDRWIGKYCEDVQVSNTDDKTILIATASSLGVVVIILILTVMIVCRSRSKKIKEAEKMHLKRFDTHGSKGLNGHLFGNQYMKDDDGGGSFSSRRLSNPSLPYGHQQRLRGNGNEEDIVQNELFPIQNRLNPYSSMPNLVDNGINFTHFDERRYSGDETRRMASHNQYLNRSYDINVRASRNSWNGSRSPLPDYGRPRSPKPDYLGSKLHRLSDSGVRNDNSSIGNEYSRQENRGLHSFSQQRQSTNF